MISSFIPFFSIYTLSRINKKLLDGKVEKKSCLGVHIGLSVIIPILPMNVVSLALIQNDVNKVNE